MKTVFVVKYLRSVVPTTELLDGRADTWVRIGTPASGCGVIVEPTMLFGPKRLCWRTGVLKEIGILWLAPGGCIG